MNKTLAQKLLKIVNSKDVLDALIEYAEFRSSKLKDELSVAKLENVHGLQGGIRELSRFKNLREEVLQAGESK